jgi:hypothetical protein
MQKRKIPWITFYVYFILLGFLVFVFSCARDQAPDSHLESQVPLLSEDRVRLSNDPDKTEIFRDAGLGLFVHWGPNSQVGSEISWPLNNASRDYMDKYYALAETFNPV